ncbi:MAG: hypothetical protein MSJ26_05650 [Oscillospiraceae bacterium]|nr:hypothetical protein [Oscillospiraceae bacterium]
MIPLEIERKFLIRRTPALFAECTEKTEIEQIYLKKKTPDIQRRVRRMTTNGNAKYYYTEKRFLSAAVREENEREITPEEYEKLRIEADSALVPILKTRYILIYSSQRFEIDTYPFSSEYASMELELADESQEIILPPYAEIIKEVTGDKRYSNAALAKNNCFPEQCHE